jgi:hypothetical protein
VLSVAGAFASLVVTALNDARGDPPFNVLQELPSLPEVAPIKSCDAGC